MALINAFLSEWTENRGGKQPEEMRKFFSASSSGAGLTGDPDGYVITSLQSLWSHSILSTQPNVGSLNHQIAVIYG